MVTRSIVDYEQHKKDVYNIISNYSQKRADKFIEFYSSRFDKYARSFLDYKFALALFDDFIGVSQNKEMAWYAVVGSGGTGKTTLSKIMGYFLDDSFGIDRIKTELWPIIRMFKKYGMEDSKSYVLDEPDINISANSREGKIARNVFGKARQQKAFMIFCATDFADIPNYIYKKINRIVYCIRKGKAMLLKDVPHKKIFFMGKLKKDYLEKLSYGIFFKREYLKYALRFDTTASTPLSNEEEQLYDDNKKKDYIETLTKADRIFANSTKINFKLSERDKIVMNMHKQGKSTIEIGKLIGLSQPRISQIINDFKRLNDKNAN